MQDKQRADEISNRRKEFQKEDGGRKYFVQAANRCQKGQTEKQTEGRWNFKKRTAAENILSKPSTDIRRNRQKNRQRADEI